MSTKSVASLNSNLSNDEYIMKKLTEMSNQFTNENMQQTKSNNWEKKQFIKAQYDDEFPCEDINKDEEAFKTELRSFLKAHNIKDGNLVETRRIDLRASQNLIKPMSSQRAAESSIESLIASISTENKKDTFKYLNEPDESSESSSDDDVDDKYDRELWIERYRKQKEQLKK
jgi:hypothetical protein